MKRPATVTIGWRQLTMTEPGPFGPREVATGLFVPTITLSGDWNYAWEGQRIYRSPREALTNLLDDAIGDGDGEFQLPDWLEPHHGEIRQLVRRELIRKNTP